MKSSAARTGTGLTAGAGFYVWKSGQSQRLCQILTRSQTMNQKALEAAIRTTLLDCLPADWALPVIAGNQPTGQGREDGIYFFRIGDGKRGWLSRKYRSQGDDLLLTESQWAETEYQFSALVADDINDDTQLLAGDVLDIVRSTLSGIVIDTL